MLSDPSGLGSIGVCPKAFIGAFIIGSAQVCVTAAVSLHHWPSVGVTETVGAGVATGVLAGLTPFNIDISTAGCVNEVGGPFTEVGAIGGEVAQGSFSIFGAGSVAGVSVGAGGGVDYTPPFLPGAIYAAHTETGTYSVGGKCGQISK